MTTANTERQFISCMLVLGLLLTSFSPVFADSTQERPNVSALLSSRRPSVLLAGVTQEKQKAQVDDRWSDEITEQSHMAQDLNNELYPNPNLQAYVNTVGQSLVPAEASDEVILSFKIVSDPIPEIYSLATGTVFVSTGMLSMLDNESQLAFVLAHEASHVMLSHHLYKIIEDVNSDAQAKKRRTALAIFGGLAGGIAGSRGGGGTSGAVAGAAIGGTLGFGFGGIRSHRGSIRFSKGLEDEADLLATELALTHNYDVRETPSLMTKMETVVKGSPEIGLAFASDRKHLQERKANLASLFSGTYKSSIDSALSSNGFKMSSPRFNQLMAELKRDNGIMALERDLFAIARANLEEASAIRTDDAVTMYGLGTLYRAIARTPEDRSKASGYFKAAIKMDEGRNRFPWAHLQYAVELINQENPQLSADVQRELKTYVVLYQRNNKGDTPPEMRFIYDYLELAGDKTWAAVPVGNVNPNPPYQRLDGEPSTAAASLATGAKR